MHSKSIASNVSFVLFALEQMILVGAHSSPAIVFKFSPSFFAYETPRSVSGRSMSLEYLGFIASSASECRIRISRKEEDEEDEDEEDDEEEARTTTTGTAARPRREVLRILLLAAIPLSSLVGVVVVVVVVRENIFSFKGFCLP
jgi:hypothetical protein